jgi:hypothetical protein
LPLLLVCSGRPPFCTRSSSTTRKNVQFRTTRKVHVFADKRNDLFWYQMPTGTFRLPWLRFFRVFSSVVRQMSGYNSQRRGTARTLPN